MANIPPQRKLIFYVDINGERAHPTGAMKTTVKTVVYKGIILCQSYQSPTTGLECQTPQGWIYKVRREAGNYDLTPDNLEPWGTAFSWAASLTAARLWIDELIERYNSGAKCNSANLLELTLEEGHINKTRRATILNAKTAEQAAERLRFASIARANRDLFCCLKIEDVVPHLTAATIRNILAAQGVTAPDPGNSFYDDHADLQG